MKFVMLFLFITGLLFVILSRACHSAPVGDTIDYCDNIPEEIRGMFNETCGPKTPTPTPAPAPAPSTSPDYENMVDTEVIEDCQRNNKPCKLLQSHAVTSNRELYEGDITNIDTETLKNMKDKKTQANGLRDKSKHWPDAIVPYELSPMLKHQYEDTIRAAMEYIEKETCVRFRARTNEKDYIRFIAGFGCYSDAGKVSGKQEISLQIPSCLQKQGLIQHEIMHALGFYHEQARSDRDQYVKINWSNIGERDQLQFQSYMPKDITAFDQPYDFESVMHYGKYDFALRDGEWTIKPKDEYKEFDSKIGQREQISRIDLIKINRMYGCNGPVTCPNDAGWESYKGKCYYVSFKDDNADKAAYNGARGACRRLGAALINPNDDMVTNFLTPAMNDASLDEGIWVDGCRSVQGGTVIDADSCSSQLHYVCYRNKKKSPQG